MSSVTFVWLLKKQGTFELVFLNCTLYTIQAYSIQIRVHIDLSNKKLLFENNEFFDYFDQFENIPKCPMS